MVPGLPHVLLVGNPSAQSGKNAARIARARELLDEQGLHHEFLATSPGGATIPAVRDALANLSFTTVIAMGGDGTFAEVAKGLFASGRTGDVRFGMLPTGTANDQGKSFGLLANVDALARNVLVIREGYVLHLDQSGHLADNLARVGVTHSQLVRGSKIDLELFAHDEPIFGQIDGEEFPSSRRVEIRVLRQAMRLIVPHDYAANEAR